MPSETKTIKRAAKALRRLQDEQAKAVTRVGRLRCKLEKAGRKMQVLEAEMVRLERHVHTLRNPGGQPITQEAKGLRPATVIINPNSGSFARQAGSVEKLVAMLRAHGIEARVHLKTSGRAVRRWARDAVESKEELVIAVGGDGTIEDVAPALAGSRTALGIIPTGTMNNLARALGIPLDIEQACALLGAGITRQIDIGCVRTTDETEDTYFLETAGLGLSIALPAGQNVRKRRWRKLPADFRRLFDIGATPIEIEPEDCDKIETQVKLVTVSNAPLFGTNNLIAPDAKMDDGLLDLAVYDGLSDLELAGYFLSNARGQRVCNPNVRFYRTRRVRIRLEQELPVTSDKDLLPDQAELEIEVIPRAIRVIVGQGSGLNWPGYAVQSVPPLTGEQLRSGSDHTAEQGTETAGPERAAAERPAPQPEALPVSGK